MSGSESGSDDLEKGLETDVVDTRIETSSSSGSTASVDPCAEPTKVYVHYDFRRSMPGVFHMMTRRGKDCITFSYDRQVILGLQGGCFIAFGAALSVFLSTGVDDFRGPQYLLTAIGFISGFAITIFSGAALFTEINVVMPISYLGLTEQCKNCLRFWFTTFWTNYFGAILVGLLLRGSHLLGHDEQERLWRIMARKMENELEGTNGWFRTFLSGIVGNWLVGMAVVNAMAAVTTTGRFVGLSLPVLSFVALGVQHSTANMGYFAIGLLNHYNISPELKDKYDEHITWGKVLWHNLIPAALGNIVGGAVFVAMLIYYVFIYGNNLKFIMTNPMGLYPPANPPVPAIVPPANDDRSDDSGSESNTNSELDSDGGGPRRGSNGKLTATVVGRPLNRDDRNVGNGRGRDGGGKSGRLRKGKRRSVVTPRGDGSSDDGSSASESGGGGGRRERQRRGDSRRGR